MGRTLFFMLVLTAFAAAFAQEKDCKEGPCLCDVCPEFCNYEPCQLMLGTLPVLGESALINSEFSS